MGPWYEAPIDCIEPKCTSSKAMTTPYGRPSTIALEPTPHSSHIIPSNEESISCQASLPPSIDIDCLPQYLTKITSTDPSDATVRKNSVEPLSISTINVVHRCARNLPPILPSSTPAPCDYWTQFESLNLHHIFGCRKFLNKKHLTTATNASLLNLGLLPSTIVYFATIANPPKVKLIKKWRQYLEKIHMDIVFGDCVALGGHQYALLIVGVVRCFLLRNFLQPKMWWRFRDSNWVQ